MKGIYSFLAILTIASVSGFYLILDNVGSLKSEIKNLELSLEILSKKSESPNTQIKEETNAGQAISPETKSENTIIPTSIILKTESSPILSPQTKLTITIDSVVKEKDGTVNVNIKVFTNDATAYSAWEPRDFFEIISISAENQKALQVKGQFNSMPPKTSISGSLVFKIEPGQNTLILQVGPENSANYYEFNFLKKSYKETVIG